MAQERYNSIEQKLVDLCFEIALMLSSPGYDKEGIYHDMTKWTDKKKASWIAEQLRQNGFDTTPMGMSWGVLKKTKKER